MYAAKSFTPCAERRIRHVLRGQSFTRFKLGRILPYSPPHWASGDPSVADVDRRAERDLVVELDHVRDRHADAPVRGRRAERCDLVGAVDAGAVVEAHPARLER